MLLQLRKVLEKRLNADLADTKTVTKTCADPPGNEKAPERYDTCSKYSVATCVVPDTAGEQLHNGRRILSIILAILAIMAWQKRNQQF